MAKICFLTTICFLNILFLHFSHADKLSRSIHYYVRNEKLECNGLPLNMNKVTLNYYGDMEAKSFSVKKPSKSFIVWGNEITSREMNILKIKMISSIRLLQLTMSNFTSDIKNITIQYGELPTYEYIYILGYFPLNNKAICSKSFEQSYIFNDEYDIYSDRIIDLKCTFKKETNPLIRIRYGMILRNLQGRDLQILTNIARKETFERYNSTFITYTYSMKLSQYYKKKVHCMIYYAEDTQYMDDVKNYNCYDETKSCSTENIRIIEPFSVDIHMNTSSHIMTCSSNMSYVSLSLISVPIQWKFVNIVNETTLIKIFIFDYGTEYYYENISCIGSYKSKNITSNIKYKREPETIWEKIIYYMTNIMYYYYDNMKLYNFILVTAFIILLYYISYV